MAAFTQAIKERDLHLFWSPDSNCPYLKTGLLCAATMRVANLILRTHVSMRWTKQCCFNNVNLFFCLLLSFVFTPQHDFNRGGWATNSEVRFLSHHHCCGQFLPYELYKIRYWNDTSILLSEGNTCTYDSVQLQSRDFVIVRKKFLFFKCANNCDDI